jgi:Tfp pilus assembly protein PilF
MKMKKFVSFLLVLAALIPAVTLYSKEFKPDTAEYYLSDGIFYLNSGNFDMAEKQLLMALKKKPALVDALHGLGIVYLNKRDFKKSVEYFQQVVRINPNSYDAYNYLGIAYSELGEYNLAKENLLTAANADKYRTPENAFVNLAMLEIREKRFDAATRYVDKGMEKNARFAPLFNLRGIIAENEGNFQDALNWYEQGLALLKEEDATYLVNMGRVYIKLDQKSKALDILEKALSKATNEQIKKQIREMIKSVE